MSRRVVLALEALLLGTGCAATARMGGQFRSLDALPVAEAQVTFGPGVGTASDGTGVQIVMPVIALSTGGQLNESDPQGAFEVGTEFSAVDHRRGWRLSPRVGAGMFGTRGAYLGLRGGPTLALAPVEGDRWTPTLTLEGLAAVGLGAELDDAAVFGATVSFGWDLYGTFHMPHGRPLRNAAGSAWLARVHAGPTSSVASAGCTLATDDRLLLGQRWLEEARAEYASIASFVQLAKELRGLGAPRELIRRAYVAAQDEVRHAELCFSLASDYLGADVHPEPLPPVAVRPNTTHRSLALECWLDGCLGEGAAAHLAAVRAARTSQPHTRAALARIARDEATHAELGWDVLAWCMHQAPTAVRDALHSKPNASSAPPDTARRSAELRRLASHGLFATEEFNAVMAVVRRRASTRLDAVFTQNASRPALRQRVTEHAGVQQGVDFG